MSRGILLAAAVLLLGALPCWGQAEEAIAYRLVSWNTKHFDDASEATKHLEAVQKLGCEAKQNQHNGHTDVTYRAAKWRAFDVSEAKLAEQWLAWLQVAGFETLRGRTQTQAEAARGAHNEEIAFRMPAWKTTHFQDKAQLAEFLAIMKGCGCEVVTEQHEGHIDARVRCAEWRQITLASHKAAHVWESWFTSNGFQVQHSH